MQPEIFDYIPLWLYFLIIFGAIAASIEGGYRLGIYRRLRSLQEKESPVGAMVGASLGLLALMLAFTFGMVGARFDETRKTILDEANSIGTTYLRAGLFADPHRSQIRKLLKEYVDVRVGVTMENFREVTKKSEEIQDRLWAQATQLADSDRSPVIVSLFIQSLNETIDLHSKRVNVGIQRRIPEPIWFSVFAIAVFSLSTMGYHAGISGTRRPMIVFSVALSFAIVILLIVDLDRPGKGLIQVGQQSMIDLQNKLNASPTK